MADNVELVGGIITSVGGNRVKIMKTRYNVPTVVIGLHVFTGDEVHTLVDLINKHGLGKEK
jgi:hypothetical protein